MSEMKEINMSDSKCDEVVELGNCFKVAANLTTPILGIVSDKLAGLTNVTLVHGIVTGQGCLDGLRYTHAWVEGYTKDGIRMAVDASNGPWEGAPAAHPEPRFNDSKFGVEQHQSVA